MAECFACGRDMTDAAGCDEDRTIEFADGVTTTPIPYGEGAVDVDTQTACHDCGADAGEYHHPGCDLETCPGCGAQYFLCDCRTTEKLELWEQPMIAKQDWMEHIASQETRAGAREVFDGWLDMRAWHDAVTFVERTNDVGVLHVEAGEPNTPNVDNHIARDLIANYGGGRNPVRCIDVTGVSRGVVQLNMLLAELEVSDPREATDD